MKTISLPKVLAAAIKAARAAGHVMLANWHLPKRVNSSESHDIKLELDVRCQKLIEKILRAPFPEIPVLGEEGVTGDMNAEYRWVVDPIDGTVNFAHGIPHCCVSIALQSRVSSFEFRVSGSRTKHKTPNTKHETSIGVVYDPFTDELWTAIRGQPARLNGKTIHVSRRDKLSQAIVAIGFSKSRKSIENTLPYFSWLVRRARKVRMTGSAALGLTYVASGRFDAYIERGISEWDIAAGGLIIECAGGEFWCEPIAGKYKYRMVASNGLFRAKLRLGNLLK